MKKLQKMKSLCCSEKCSSFEVKFPAEWQGQKIHIDGTLIKDSTIQKCDYAFFIKNNENKKYILIYIELKGMDLMKAVSQLENTIKILKDNKDFQGYPEQEAHAVCSRIPTYPQIDSRFQNEVMRFKKQYCFLLKRHSQKGTKVLYPF